MAKGSQKTIIVNSRYSYILEHLDAVKALEAIYEETKIQVPKWVGGKLLTEIKKLFEEQKWSISFDNNYYEISVFPKYRFDEKKDIGPYFGIEGFNWGCMNAEERDEAPWTYLWYRSPKKKTHQFLSWEKKVHRVIDKERKKIERLGFEVKPFPDDKNYLILHFLQKETNIKRLIDNPQKFIDASVNIFMDFFEKTKYLLERFPKL